MRSLGFNLGTWTGFEFWKNMMPWRWQARSVFKRLTRPGRPWHGHDFHSVSHVISTAGGQFVVVQLGTGRFDVEPKPPGTEGSPL